MALTLKKILLTLIFLTQTMGNAMASDLSANDKFEIIDVMNNYAKGIDTKNYDLFRSIFDDNVEVNIIYDSSFRSGEPVSFDGIDSWVQYVENAISEYTSTQHMLGNPLIKYEDGKKLFLAGEKLEIVFIKFKMNIQKKFFDKTIILASSFIKFES